MMSAVVQYSYTNYCCKDNLWIYSEKQSPSELVHTRGNYKSRLVIEMQTEAKHELSKHSLILIY